MKNRWKQHINRLRVWICIIKDSKKEKLYNKIIQNKIMIKFKMKKIMMIGKT